MLVYLCILYAFLNWWTDFDELVCVCLSGSRDDLDSQLDPVGLTRGGAQMGILRFMAEMFVYKWLLLLCLLKKLIYNYLSRCAAILKNIISYYNSTIIYLYMGLAWPFMLLF